MPFDLFPGGAKAAWWLTTVQADPCEADAYARALDARDARFDGVFFVGIVTTRIYCRPICPARVSHHSHRRFFTSAAAAERAGYRPCLRCRPELAPGRSVVDALPRLAHVAERRIAAGALNGRSVADLARELGVSERHLRRAFRREIGVSPIELAQTHRLLLAKRLLADTTLPVTRVAYASGFQSLRRFNAAFRQQYRMPPSALRRAPHRARRATAAPSPGDAPLRLTLAYRAPLAWDTLLAVLRCDAVRGVEIVEGGRYGRAVHVEGRRGVVVVENAAGRDGERTSSACGRGEVARAGRPAHTHVARAHARHMSHATRVNVELSPSLVPALMPLLARLRHLFDLDAEPTVIDAHLAQGGLASLVERRPGLRIPGAVDGFDLALRVLLRGRAFMTREHSASGDVAQRVAWTLGEPIETGISGLTRLAPTADRIAEVRAARLCSLGVPRRRAEAVAALSRHVAEGTLHLEPGGDPAATHRALIDVTGMGGELASAIVMRTLGWPDAFPASDRALQRAAGAEGARALRTYAERWRPWRAYAALHLWLHGAAGCDADPGIHYSYGVRRPSASSNSTGPRGQER